VDAEEDRDRDEKGVEKGVRLRRDDEARRTTRGERATTTTTGTTTTTTTRFAIRRVRGRDDARVHRCTRLRARIQNARNSIRMHPLVLVSHYLKFEITARFEM